MKALLLSICFVVRLAFTFNANAQSQSWALMNNEGAFTVDAIEPLPDGSVIVTGTSAGELDSLYYTYTYSNVIARIDQSGNILWAKEFEGTNSSYYYGYGGATTIMYANNAIYANVCSYDDMYNSVETILKIDLNGNVVAAKNVTGTYLGYYSKNKLAKLPNGDIALLKSLSSEFQVVCFTNNLEMQWARSINPDSSCYKNPAMDFTIDEEDTTIVICGKSDNRMVMTTITTDGEFQSGYRYDNTGDYLRAYKVLKHGNDFIVFGLYTGYDSIGGYAGQSFVSRVSTNGNIVWIKTLEDANNQVYDFTIYSAFTLPNGNFFFSGMVGYTGAAVLGEMDGNGNMVWSRISNDPVSSYTFSTGMVPTAVSGSQIATVSNVSIYPYGTTSQILFTDALTLKLNEACSFMQSDVSIVDLDFDYTIHAMPASNVADIASASVYSNATVEFTDITSQIEAVEVCSTVHTSVNSVNDANDIAVSPNPAMDMISISGITRGTVKIYNAIGALVVENTTDGNKLDVNVAQLPNGMYMVVCANGDNSISRKFVVQH